MKEENGRILGVIGGMGPLATQLFYKMVTENTVAGRDQDHINMIILSHATMPDRTKAILEGRTEEVLDKLGTDAKFLEESGATCIAIPCNTTHVIMDRLQERTGIPIINMIEETADEAAALGVERVGILATDGTIKAGLYHKACGKRGIEPLTPPEDIQSIIMDIIYRTVKGGGELDPGAVRAIEGWLESEDCRYAVLGCTELPLIKQHFSRDLHCIDAMLVLARRSIEMCGGTLTAQPR